MAVPLVSSAKGVTFGAFQRSIASFRVAGVALRGISTSFMMCHKSFCVAGAILLPHFQKMRWIFRGKRSTLETSDVMLRGRRSTLDVSCCIFFADRNVRAARRGDTHHSTHLHSLHITLHTPHFTPDSTLTFYTLRAQVHTSNSTLYTPHFQLCTQHPTLSTLHFPLYTPHFTLHSLRPHT